MTPPNRCQLLHNMQPTQWECCFSKTFNLKQRLAGLFYSRISNVSIGPWKASRIQVVGAMKPGTVHGAHGGQQAGDWTALALVREGGSRQGLARMRGGRACASGLRVAARLDRGQGHSGHAPEAASLPSGTQDHCFPSSPSPLGRPVHRPGPSAFELS